MVIRKTRKYYKRQAESLKNIDDKKKDLIFIYKPVELPLKKKGVSK